MPFTVITLRNVPQSLRGDLTKWMQEVATGVYVGNFNTKIRESLWDRVLSTAGTGEVTLSYACRNEIGYSFETVGADRQVIDCDGIPLVMIPNDRPFSESLNNGFSNAYKFRKARRSNVKSHKDDLIKYVVLNIETTGTNAVRDKITEIGAVRYNNEHLDYFQRLILSDELISQNTTSLTEITRDTLMKEGVPLKKALSELIEFIGDYNLVGYDVGSDLRFINNALGSFQKQPVHNNVHDLLKVIKKENLFQHDYELQTSLTTYGIEDTVQHKALDDAKLIYKLAEKLKKI